MLASSRSSENFEAKLVDFGLAMKLKKGQTHDDSQQSSHNVVEGAGTVGYKAPEIVAGEPFGPASDIWSLGCLLHAMLTVALPYHSEDDMSSDDNENDQAVGNNGRSNQKCDEEFKQMIS